MTCARSLVPLSMILLATSLVGAGDADKKLALKDGERILFFGDSFTAGDGCNNADRFAERVVARYIG